MSLSGSSFEPGEVGCALPHMLTWCHAGNHHDCSNVFSLRQRLLAFLGLFSEAVRFTNVKNYFQVKADNVIH